jgi:predicted Zn-dependent peptidase
MLRNATQLFARSYSSEAAVKTSVLGNGLKVVSVDDGTNFSSLGLFIEAGSRHERCSSLGTSHALSRLATYSTFNRSNVRVIHDVENVHNFNLCRGRERTAITASSLRGESGATARLLLDVARPRCIEYEIKGIVDAVNNDTAAAQADPCKFLEDELHSAAFRSVGLGRSLYAHNAGSLTQEQILEYLFSNWTAATSVFVATNVNHDEIVSELEAQGGFKNHVEGFTVDRAAGQPYVGGESRRQTNGDVHFAAAFKGYSATEGGQDVQPLLAQLFSARLGPSWCANSHTYSDNGLLSFATTVGSGAGDSAVEALVSGLKGASFTAEEVQAAKLAVAAKATLNNEVAAHRLASLIVPAGNVNAVTVDQVNAAAKSVLSSKVSLASTGNLARLPSANTIESAL